LWGLGFIAAGFYLLDQLDDPTDPTRAERAGPTLGMLACFFLGVFSAGFGIKQHVHRWMMNWARQKQHNGEL